MALLEKLLDQRHGQTNGALALKTFTQPARDVYRQRGAKFFHEPLTDHSVNQETMRIVNHPPSSHHCLLRSRTTRLEAAVLGTESSSPRIRACPTGDFAHRIGTYARNNSYSTLFHNIMQCIEASIDRPFPTATLRSVVLFTQCPTSNVQHCSMRWWVKVH